MTIKETLTAARDLILSPAHWCQGWRNARIRPGGAFQ